MTQMIIRTQPPKPSSKGSVGANIPQPRKTKLVINCGRERKRMLDLGTSMKLLDLPNELIEQILTEVHPIEVVHICRRLHELVDGSIELRLRIELAIDGWLLSERGEEPAETVLRQIHQRRLAWENFRPRSFWEIEYANTENMTYEILAGTFGYSEDPADSTSFRKLKFEELISPESEGGRWSFGIGNLGIDAQEFSYSLDADALLLIESCEDGAIWRIHFRELSTNEPHPQAAQPTMDFLRSECEVWESCEVLNHEEIAVIEFSDHLGFNDTKRVAALILNWRTGRVLLPYTVTIDLVVLNNCTVIIAPIAANGDEFMTLDVRSLESGESLYRCKLPMPVGQFGLRFQKRAQANPGPKPPHRGQATYKPDPRIEILVLVFYSTNIPIREWFTAVLSVDLFQRKCQSLLESRSESDSDMGIVSIFEWEEWGPSVSRWLPLDIHGEYGSRNTIGSKMLAIKMEETEEGDIALYNMILDFNPWPMRRSAEWNRVENEYMSFMECEEAVWHRDDMVVMSSLPFRAWISSRRCQYLNFFLDGNTIVGRLDTGCHFFSFLSGPNNNEGEIPHLL